VFLGKHQGSWAQKTASVLNKVTLSGFETDDRRTPHSDAGRGKVRGVYGFLFSASMRDRCAFGRVILDWDIQARFDPISQERRIMMQGE
jgi:hypothetical protein